MIVSKKAKISLYGNPKAKTVWIALHGYGQLSNFFIRKFHTLDEEKNYVIAPEGLHRFYVKGTGGRVGASWMTKEERESDIQDYIKYLDQVYDEYGIEDYDQVVLLGFSQGAATSARWMEFGKIKPSVYLHWAGVFPPDLDFDPKQNVFEESTNYYLVGTEDQFFNQEHIQTEIRNFKSKGIEIEYVSFGGTHNLDSTILKSFDEKLN
jgi:predicted esterase